MNQEQAKRNLLRLTTIINDLKDSSQLVPLSSSRTHLPTLSNILTHLPADPTDHILLLLHLSKVRLCIALQRAIDPILLRLKLVHHQLTILATLEEDPLRNSSSSDNIECRLRPTALLGMDNLIATLRCLLLWLAVAVVLLLLRLPRTLVKGTPFLDDEEGSNTLSLTPVRPDDAERPPSIPQYFLFTYLLNNMLYLSPLDCPYSPLLLPSPQVAVPCYCAHVSHVHRCLF